MGNIVGGLIGGVGSLLGGQSAKSNALTGYNYLSGKNGVGGVVNTGTNANGMEAQLLGAAPESAATKTAYNNYLGSSGYDFALKQGAGAITGSAAARGILGSGATGKVLTTFGQGQAAQSFDNYLGKLGGLTSSGLTASGQIGQAGTQGGETAANGMQGGITKAGGALAGIANFLLA